MSAARSRADVLGHVDALKLHWPEEHDLWHGLVERVGGCTPSELEVLGGLLAALAADLSQARPPSAYSPQLPEARTHIEQFMAQAGCPDPATMVRILNRHGFYYRGRKTVCLALLRGVTGSVADAMRPLVSWGLSSPYGRISGADGLAEWAGCRGSVADLLSRVRDASAETSLAAAREIWKQGMRGEGDLSEVLIALEQGLEVSAPNGPFFLSCVRRILLRTQDPEAVLPAVVPAASLPQVETSIRTSFTSFELTSSSDFESLRKFDKGTYKPRPVRPGGFCRVCASDRVTCVYSEAWGHISGRWSLSELLCEECGCYSADNVDD